MEETLINFVTANLAKKKGFDKIIRYGNEASLYDRKGEHVYYVNYGFMGSGLDAGYISAPTQSLLQKWLREVHNIETRADVNFYNKKHKLGYLYSIDCFDENNIHDGKDYDLHQLEKVGKSEGFNTYEEALEIGLQEALKLIK